MAQRNIQVTVARYDPEHDEAPYDQTYQVPVGEFTCVLDVLDYIYENLDQTLAYYDHAACQHAICRRCVLQINGVSSLMCQTLVTGDIRLAPPPKFNVLRDLVYARGGD
jgi:succinate dehydrogenase/fumarate reductase-like Fe-S protein